MSNAVVEKKDAATSPVQQFVQQVLPPSKRDDVLASLPAHIKPERFERNLVNAVMLNPKIMGVDPRVVYREVSKIAAVGLLLDPQFGEAYLIVDRHNDIQARIGYRGLMKLARQSGLIADISAHDICEHDETDIQLGTDKRLHHKPNFMKPRGDVGAYYAVVKFADGTRDFEVMTIAEIEAIRERSDGWRAFKAGKIKTTPWGTDFSEMAKKTVLRRLCKRLPMSPELMDALADEDRADEREYRDPAPVRPSLAERFSVPALPAAEGFSREHVDLETGEITEHQNSGDAPPSPSEDAGASPAPHSEAPAPESSEPSLKDRLLASLSEIDSNVDLGRWWANPKVIQAVDGLSESDADELQKAYDAKAAALTADDGDFPGDKPMDGGK